MDFMLGNIPIHNARNIEWKSNGDGTVQLWFNSVLVDKNDKEQDCRFHMFRLKLKFDDLPMSLEPVDGKLWEVEVVDYSF